MLYIIQNATSIGIIYHVLVVPCTIYCTSLLLCEGGGSIGWLDVWPYTNLVSVEDTSWCDELWWGVYVSTYYAWLYSDPPCCYDEIPLYILIWVQGTHEQSVLVDDGAIWEVVHREEEEECYPIRIVCEGEGGYPVPHSLSVPEWCPLSELAYHERSIFRTECRYATRFGQDGEVYWYAGQYCSGAVRSWGSVGIYFPAVSYQSVGIVRVYVLKY